MRGGRFLAVGLAALAAGCGFQPVYGVHRPSRPALAAVYVDIIPNRSGQLLRQALQAQLEGAANEAPKRYTLSVSYAEAIQGLDVQADNSTTRNRDVGTASWSLHASDTPLVWLAGGTVRSVDGYNIIDQQFFYQDLEEDATQRRLAEALANQIVLAVGVFFDKHPG
jgi:LPS-assembly lipoprotein